MPELSAVAIGSYAPGLGLSSYRVEAGGRLRPIDAVDVEAASCLSWDPVGRRLHVVNELPRGTVTTVEVCPGSTLRIRGTAATGGTGPCHLALDPRRALVTANYGDGTISLLPLTAAGATRDATWTLAFLVPPDAPAGTASHPHMIVRRDAGWWVTDLGLDRIHVVTDRNGNGDLHTRSLVVPAGTGPRQLRFLSGASCDFLVLGERSSRLLRMSSTGTGATEVVSSVRTTAAPGPNHPAHLECSPDGRTALVSNRGADTLAVVDLTSGALDLLTEVPCGGRWPRQFAVVENLLLVANERSDQVSVFTLSTDWRSLTPLSSHPLPRPAWIAGLDRANSSPTTEGTTMTVRPGQTP